MKRLSDLVAALGATTARRWWTSFAIILLLSLSWSVATPLFASPDEPAHVIRAASVARGQVLGRTPPHDPHGQLLVRVPAIFENGNNASCFAFSPNTTAKCLTFTGSTRTVEVSTTAGRHPPLYYAVVGWPSLAFKSDVGVRLMRLVTALLAAALLACAVTAILSLPSRRLAALGLAVAVTPMVLFLNGVVNPSPVEIAAAACVWAAGIVLVVDPASELRPTLITYFGIGACALALTRQLGPLWLGIAGVLLAWIGGADLVRGVFRERRFRRWAAAAVVSCALQVAWILSTGTLNAASGSTQGVHTNTGFLIRGSIGRSLLYYRELIGVFGWRDTVPPSFVPIVWTAAIGGIAVLVLWVGTRRVRQSILAIAVLSVAIPVFSEVLDAHDAGYFWQGRYTLPLAVGIPIVGAVSAARSEGAARLDAKRLAWTFAIGLGFAHVLAFAQALRRYTLGATSDSLNIFSGTPWSPPGGAALLCAVFVLATVAWFAWLFAGVRSGADGTLAVADGAARSSPVEARTAPTRSTDLLRAPR
jgi:Predicted membrane protein (DUF2142)